MKAYILHCCSVSESGDVAFLYTGAGAFCCSASLVIMVDDDDEDVRRSRSGEERRVDDCERARGDRDLDLAGRGERERALLYTRDNDDDECLLVEGGDRDRRR